MRYCGGDRDVTANGFLYPAGGGTGPYFDRQDNKAKCHWKVGVAVDQLVFDVLPGNATVLGESFLAAVLQGVFDSAELTLERAFMGAYGDTSSGTVILFAGRVADIDCGRSLATFTVNSHLELLNISLPRNLWQASCVNNLGDASCTVDLSGYAVSGAAATGSTASVVAASLGNATGYFDLGKIIFTGGANAGLWRGVKSWVAGSAGASGTVSLLAPFPAAPAAGDGFTIYPGCDKSLGANGCAKFSNTAHFRGFPYVPTPETAV